MTDIDSMPAGMEMDRLVAEKVMGWIPGTGDRSSWWWHSKVGDWFRSMTDGARTDEGDERWSPSTNIAHAWEVVEKMRGRGVWIDVYTQSTFYAAVATQRDQTDNDADADTAPLAICRAALKAVGHGQ